MSHGLDPHEIEMDLQEHIDPERDQSEQFEYAILMPAKPPKDKQDATDKFESRMKELSKIGIISKEFTSADGNSRFFLLTATPERFEIEAERTELNMKLKPELGGAYSSFIIEEKHLYQPEDDKFFRFNQRMQLLRSILENPLDEHGAGLDMKKLAAEGIISKFYPLHDESKKQLFREWANLRCVFKYQPLDRIRDYFGEELALYFAWLGFYTSWLWLAAIFGLACAIPWLRSFDWNADDEKLSTGVWANTAYSIFLAIWTTVFLEFWKRKSNTLVYRWGTSDWEDKEEERPEFHGNDALGTYWENTWIPWDESLKDYITHVTPYFPSLTTKSRIGRALPFIATMCAFVVAVTYAIFVLKLLLAKIANGDPWPGIVTGIINAVSIIIMNTVWQKVAVLLTNWENHRTQTAYDDQLIFKVFAFQFVNSYTSLYYIAFFKAKHGPLIQSDKEDYSESCLYTSDKTYCGNELAVQLATILLTNIVVGQAQEFVLPWILGFAKRFWNARKGGVAAKEFTQVEKEATYADYGGTFNEYSEMVIQYGFLTLFAAALPIAPLLAVINNMVEIRTDAARFLTSTNRPHYRGATDIGTWFLLLQFLSYVGVVTNCVLIGETFPTLRSRLSEMGDFSVIKPFWTLLTVVLLEHVIIGIKALIAFLIPDVPGEVKRALAKERYLMYRTFRRCRRDVAENYSLLSKEEQEREKHSLPAEIQEAKDHNDALHRKASETVVQME